MISDTTRCKKAMQRKTLPIKELEKIWLTSDEACALLNCKRDFLENLRNAAEISFAKVGGKYYHDLASIHLMFERHRIPAKAI